MPLELKSFRLPIEWGPKTDEWGPETDKDQNSPRLFLKNSFGVDLPINGGWGYSEEDCVVIDKNDSMKDQSTLFDENKVKTIFVQKRIYAELIVFRPPGDGFSGIEWSRESQRVIDTNSRKYEVLEFYVRAYAERDWEYLKQDWHDMKYNRTPDYDENRAREHQLERLKRKCFYRTEYWFDITSFYEKTASVLVV